MKEVEKKIQVDDNRFLIYRITNGYVKPTYTITEGFLEDGILLSTYSLSQWDDYGLGGWINNDEGIDKISFEFDKNHPLFLPLFHLLNYDNELLIDDDDTKEKNQKYMLVRREKDKIYLDFVDHLEDSDSFEERFNVFIKNILFDGRSKIDQEQKDTKKRLLTFFAEANNALINDYNQITMEESLLENATNDDYEQMKRVFKRKI